MMNGEYSSKDLFLPERILHVGQMREKYFSSGSMEGIYGVRSEILMGWKLSYDHGFRETYHKKPVVHDLKKHQERSSRLMQIAVPYMEKILSFLDTKSFWLTLLDKEGIILKLVGNQETIAELNATGLVEGSDRGARAPYCGLFHLVYLLKKPFMLVATEHALAIDDNLAGAACPIIDKKTTAIVGYIAVSGHWWDSHLHTLGLSILASEAISQQMQLLEANQNMMELNEFIQEKNEELAQAIEDFDFGIICFDRTGNIFMLNENAIQLLNLKVGKKYIVGHNIQEYFSELSDLNYIKKQIFKDGIIHIDALESIKKTSNKKYGKTLYLSVTISKGKDKYYMLKFSERKHVENSAARIIYSQASFTLNDIIGTSNEISYAKKLAKMAAPYDTSVMILGESGTGKEMFAQAIHNESNRSQGPFIAINCGAIPRTLIESELFGYEKGAFTGADRNGHPGKFELADGGTLFLDEIGDMPYDVQVSLLRVIQTKEVLRLGSRKPIKVDVRIISATNKSLVDKIKENAFRDDLFYRLNVFTINLPPLRSRKGDIEDLANCFVEIYRKKYNKVQGFSPDAIAALLDYDWPGNIRELENTVERALIVSQGEWIENKDLSFYAGSDNRIEDHTVRIMGSKENLEEVLKQYEYNITKAARYLGVSRPTLYKKMRELHIEKIKKY